MLKTIFILFLLTFSYGAYAQDKGDDKIIYIAISEVSMGGSVGTSEQLNHLLSHNGSRTGGLKSRLSSGSVSGFQGDIIIYNKENIRFFDKTCDYLNKPLDCGVKNKHWTLKTYVHVGNKYSTISVKLYDEKGREVSKGSKTAWGTVRYVPQWKLTRVKEKGGMMGAKETEVFEMYPPKIEELPPLLTPFHVSQAIGLMYASVRTYK